MAFPKSPTKNVTGKLKLSIRPPLEEVVGDSDYADLSPKGRDLIHNFNFKLPTGFNITNNIRSVLTKQRDFVLSQLHELILKRENCRNCESSVSEENVNLIRHVCLFLCGKVSCSLQSLPSLSLNHKSNADLILKFNCGNKLVQVVASNAALSLGLYENNLLKESIEKMDSLVLIDYASNWLLKN